VATAYGALGSETETPLNRVKRYQRLVTSNPDHPESHFALAEASLAAQLWGEARRHLDQLAGDRRTARLFRLMTDLEEQETGDLKAARQWLDQAANAPAENAWYCGDCGSVADAWHACCENCDAFAALEWRLPPGVSVQAPLPVTPKTAA
jgi:HemY protein